MKRYCTEEEATARLERGRQTINTEIASFAHLEPAGTTQDQRNFNAGYGVVQNIVGAGRAQSPADGDAILQGVAFGIGLIAGSYDDPNQALSVLEGCIRDGIANAALIEAGGVLQ